MAYYDDTPNGKGLNGNTFFTKSDIDQARTLNPFTDIYMFDVGFELDLHRLIAVLFNESQYVNSLISYKPPRRIIHECGFKVKFVHKFNTAMHGTYQIILIFLLNFKLNI
jgi:hypothetical protein